MTGHMEAESMLIWGYQPHFRASIQKAAEEIFGELDPNLLPKVCLVGVGIPDWGTDLVPVVTEPASCGLDPDRLEYLTEIAAGFVRDGEILLYRRHLLDDPEDEYNRYPRVLCRELERLLRARPEAERHLPFCSYPAFVDGYLVAVILELDRATFLTHHRGGEDAHSLLSTTVLEFLNASSKALTEADPGSKPLVLGREHGEIIRAAATTLTHKLTYEIRQWGYPISLFEACNEISALMYEGDEGVGTMLISAADDPAIEVQVELQNRIRLTDYRGARKMLEMSSSKISLLCDGGYIYGLGRLAADTKPRHVLRINFIKHYDWELERDGDPVMRVIYRRPFLPGKPINEQRFKQDVRAIFRGITPSEEERIWAIALEATRQHRGTMLVITTGAREEAERLENQCIRIQPITLSPDLVHTITSIDGAVLMAPNGVAHAIGVILDGLATDKETPTRGARYNSAVRYIETLKARYACLAIVVSKDGMIDLVSAQALAGLSALPLLKAQPFMTG